MKAGFSSLHNCLLKSDCSADGLNVESTHIIEQKSPSLPLYMYNKIVEPK